jgi:hypothetical protein
MKEISSETIPQIKKYKTAYILYTMERRPVLKKQNPNIKNSRDITKQIAKEWNTMPEEIKKQYRERERHEREIFETQKRESAGASRYRYKTYKKIRKPLRWRTPYMFFVRHNKPTFKGQSNLENMASLSRQWRLMNNEEKLPFVVLSNEDKKRYLIEQNIYIRTFLHLKPSKRLKLCEKPDNQLIELFKKNKAQEKQNYQLVEDIKNVIKGRHGFNFEVTKERRPIVEEVSLKYEQQPDSSEIDEIDFEMDSEENLFGDNVKYGNDALAEFRKMSKQDHELSEEYSASSEEYSD